MVFRIFGVFYVVSLLLLPFDLDVVGVVMADVCHLDLCFDFDFGFGFLVVNVRLFLFQYMVERCANPGYRFFF